MKLKPSQIKKYNKVADKKPVMVRVGHTWYTWAEGDPKHGVFLTNQNGRDVEFDFKQIDDIQESVTKLTKLKLKEIIREELLGESSRPMTKHWAEKLLGSIRNFESYWSKDDWFNKNKKIRKEIDTIHKSWKVIYKELGKV